MPSVLIVDDSPSVRQVVKLTLTRAGYSVTEAQNGSDGLNQCRSSGFSLVITDLNMPVMNGLDMIRGLRGLPNFVGTPILFLTTESDASVKQQARAAGATGWITKPFNPEQLLAAAAKFARN